MAATPCFLLNPRPPAGPQQLPAPPSASVGIRETGDGSWLRFSDGGEIGSSYVGGYARTNDYQFVTLAITVATTFPFVAAVSSPGLANAFTTLAYLESRFE